MERKKNRAGQAIEEKEKLFQVMGEKNGPCQEVRQGVLEGNHSPRRKVGEEEILVDWGSSVFPHSTGQKRKGNR